MNRTIDRRDFLRMGGLAWLASRGAQPTRPSALSGGRLLGTLPLGGEGTQTPPPFGTLLGSGLDARLFADLSTLTADTLITPSDRFFIRTTCPPTVSSDRPWTIPLGGLVRTPDAIALDALGELVRPMGT